MKGVNEREYMISTTQILETAVSKALDVIEKDDSPALVVEVHGTEGMVLVKEGTVEAEKRKDEGVRIKTYETKRGNYILCHS